MLENRPAVPLLPMLDLLTLADLLILIRDEPDFGLLEVLSIFLWLAVFRVEDSLRLRLKLATFLISF